MPSPSPVWSSAIFVGKDPAGDAWQLPPDPAALLDPSRISLAADGVHTIADPFVFAHPDSDELYLFAEVQRSRRPGRIEAWRIDADRTLRALGEVAMGPGHLSYPSVFHSGGETFIIPESGSAEWNEGFGEVALYRFTAFPTEVEKVAVLLAGSYVDSSVVHWNGLWYLFTYLAGEGLLFLSESLDGPYRMHPGSPFSSDGRYARSGGAVILPTAQRPFPLRPAQNCSASYGGDLSLMKITDWNADSYREEVWAEDIVAGQFSWAATGGHHMSQCRWRGQTVTALDGRQNDRLISRLARAVRR